MESTIPLFHCKSLEKTVEFYRALGFEVTHEQRQPYMYAAVRRGEVELHFASLRVYGLKDGFGASLVFVPQVEPYHRTFADGLRMHYGKVPTAGFPRITRLKKDQTRFKVFDPTGNILIYINADEPEMDYGAYAEQSELAQALDNAAFLRDTYSNDQAAARALDLALKKFAAAEALDRALALAARAEIAVALGDSARAQEMQIELQQITLPAEFRERYRDELQAADDLAQWLTGGYP